MRKQDPPERIAALRKNVARTVLLKVLLGTLAMVVPTVVLLWKENGMNMQDIAILQAIFACSLALFEVPTGYFADVLGRKTALMIGALLLVAGAGTYFIADSFTLFLVGELLLALGFSFASGADQALLYDTLVELGRGDEYAKLWGRASFWSFITAAVCAGIGGYAGSIHLRAPLFMEACATVGIFAVTWLLQEPSRGQNSSRRSASFKDLAQTFRASMRDDATVRWLILYPALLFGLNQISVWLYTPYFDLTGVRTEYFGLIFALFNVAAAMASRYAVRVESIWGEKMLMVAPLVCVVASYLLLSNVIFLLSFSFALLQQMVRGFTVVVYSQRLNKSISSDRRATMLSFQSMAGRIVYAVLLLPMGYFADHSGVLYTLQATGFTALGLGTLALAARYART